MQRKKGKKKEAEQIRLTLICLDMLPETQSLFWMAQAETRGVYTCLYGCIAIQ